MTTHDITGLFITFLKGTVYGHSDSTITKVIPQGSTPTHTSVCGMLF